MNNFLKKLIKKIKEMYFFEIALLVCAVIVLISATTNLIVQFLMWKWAVPGLKTFGFIPEIIGRG